MHFCCSEFFFLDLIRGTLHKSEFKIIIIYVMLAFDVATLPSSLQAHLKVLLLPNSYTQFCAYSQNSVAEMTILLS